MSDFEWNEDALERLKRTVSHSMTQQQLAERTGIPKPTLQNILGGKTDPGVARLAKIANTLGLSIDAILSDSPRDPLRTLIPTLRAKASAGDGSVVVSDETSVGPFSFEDAWLRRNVGSASSLKMIQVTGDSQEPELRDGDWVMIDESKNSIKNGLHVIRVDEYLMLKRLQLEGKFLQLLSNNPVYAGTALDLSKEADRIDVIGKVVFSFKHLG